MRHLTFPPIQVQIAKEALSLYEHAEREVCLAGYSWEVEWQRNLQFYKFTEQDLLREAAWVILCGGFKESIVRTIFNYFSLCFCDWSSAEEIISKRDACYTTAVSCFRNTKKVNAIIELCEIIICKGFSKFKEEIIESPITSLQGIPFIGPITSYHLAKNLGCNVAKNDRHLLRLANSLNYVDGIALCKDISIHTGQPVNVVDITLWRYAVLNQGRYNVGI